MTIDPLPDKGRLAGIVTAAELASVGLTESRINTLIGRDVLTRTNRGLYARSAEVRQLSATERGKAALRVAAAVTIVGPEAVGSHADAADLHGISVLTRPNPDSICVSRPLDAPRANWSRRPYINLHISDLPAEHRTVRHGVPVTTVARTVVDLARTTSLREGVVVADSALHRGQTTKADLYAVIKHCARWPGIAQARRAIDFSDALAESPFESLARLVFDQGGLPKPKLQAWIGGDGRPLGRADFYWPAHSTIAEADGSSKYNDANRARQQLQRDEDLRRAGFQIVHFTWQQLHVTPAQIVESVRAAFSQAAALRKASNQT